MNKQVTNNDSERYQQKEEFGVQLNPPGRGGGRIPEDLIPVRLHNSTIRIQAIIKIIIMLPIRHMTAAN